MKINLLGMERKYDLDDRCVAFGADVVKYAAHMPKTVAGTHLAKQLLRSGTSPALHYGEVQSAESYADFIHKMKVALKELRESRNNLRIQRQAGMVAANSASLDALLNECNSLIAIFAKSVKTAQQNSSKSRKGPGEKDQPS